MNDLLNSLGIDPGTLKNPYTPAQGWQTKLSPELEAEYQRWAPANNIPVYDSNQVVDYDMRGFYKGLFEGDPRASRGFGNDNQMHFSDYWKTPYHPSFSNESKFANEQAPRWEKDSFIPGAFNLVDQQGTLRVEDKPQMQSDYLSEIRRLVQENLDNPLYGQSIPDNFNLTVPSPIRKGVTRPYL